MRVLRGIAPRFLALLRVLLTVYEGACDWPDGKARPRQSAPSLRASIFENRVDDERGERHSRRITGPAQMSDVLAAKNAKGAKSLHRPL